MKNPHEGQDFRAFLAEEGLLEEVEAGARIKAASLSSLPSVQLRSPANKQKQTKETKMAKSNKRGHIRSNL
jgi:hypothetical protein